MPELPEVQTIVSELDEKISRKIISAVEVFKYKSVRPMNKKFVQGIVGKKIIGVARRAKMIIIELAGKKYLLIHLKMTGQLVYQSKSGKGVSGGHPIPVPAKVRQIQAYPMSGEIKDAGLPSKFTRVSFDFKDGSKLFFNDIRRFGWIKLVDEKSYLEETGKYGIEPLSEDFTLKNFKGKLRRYPNRKIKQVLMDQSLIAGVGNIYADEAAFAARVMPTRPAISLTEKEIKALHQAIPRILKLAVKMKGTSADTYITTSGEEGKMMKHLKVYGRPGQKCRGCAGTIHKMKVGGRGTHYCPACQK
ncbi:MAG: DNA-formamidopyrimidine glycosylase [Candidatus Buchananbacteria bacterium]|jgi:formamidopyrimidine-DNA glycosylase